jgi:CRISPR/Cas system-associated exonuclease Cas4 (RecB family)
MKTLLESASSLDRGLECPTSNQLEQSAPQHPNSAEAAAWGTAGHTVLEYGIEEGAAVLERIEQRHRQRAAEVLSLINRTAAKGTRLEDREVSFVYRGETGTAEVIGRNVNRRYDEALMERGMAPRGPLDITCTLDVVRVGYLSVEINDYKFGKWVGEPNKAAQLLFAAMVVVKALAPKALWVIVNFQRIREDLRRKPEDRWQVKDKPALLTREDIDLFERRVKRALVKAQQIAEDIKAGKDPEVNPGEHCRFCPSRTSCSDWLSKNKEK